MTPKRENLILTCIITVAVILAAIILAWASPAAAYWNCDGLITSNNSCIGSESNVDSYNNHEPIYTDEWIDERRTHYLNRHYEPRREAPHDRRTNHAVPRAKRSPWQ